MSQNKQKNKERRLKAILIICVCASVALCGWLAFNLLKLHNNERINTTAIVYDEDAEDVKPEVQYSDKTIIPCWDVLTFKAGTVDQVVNFHNPASNKGINFKITLYVGDEILYQSDLIQPGKVVRHIEIKEPMVAQTVSAKILYECFADDGTQLNGSKMNFILKVED